MSDQTVVNVSTHPDSRPPPKPKASKPVKLPKPPQQSSKLRGLPKDPLPVKISKTVSYLLRHGAVKEGLGGVMRKDGYLPVQALASHRSFTDPQTQQSLLTHQLLTDMVASDAKSRFSLVYASDTSPAPNSALSAEKALDVMPAPVQVTVNSGDDAVTATGASEAGQWWIRANQGHSIKVDAIEDTMIKVERAEDAGEAVHGTRQELWDTIYEQGLSKMNRQHIHMALSTPPQSIPVPLEVAGSSALSAENQAEPRGPTKKTVSGIRNQSTIYIYLDVPRLLADSVPLFLSANSVLLSPGHPQTPGTISRQYFLRAVDRKTGSVIWQRPEDSKEA